MRYTRESQTHTSSLLSGQQQRGRLHRLRCSPAAAPPPPLPPPPPPSSAGRLLRLRRDRPSGGCPHTRRLRPRRVEFHHLRPAPGRHLVDVQPGGAEGYDVSSRGSDPSFRRCIPRFTPSRGDKSGDKSGDKNSSPVTAKHDQCKSSHATFGRTHAGTASCRRTNGDFSPSRQNTPTSQLKRRLVSGKKTKTSQKQAKPRM